MLLSNMLLDVVKDRHSCRPVTVSRSQLHIFLCHNDDKHDHVRLSAFILTEWRDGLFPFCCINGEFIQGEGEIE